MDVATLKIKEQLNECELDYEQKFKYKLRIFETIFPEKCLNAVPDNIINKVLKDVDHIYEELTK